MSFEWKEELVPVQEQGARPVPRWMAWLAYRDYHGRLHFSQSLERILQRGGFGQNELIEHLAYTARALLEQLQSRVTERRQNCACPLCGDSEYHAEGCEIGQLQAEAEQLKQRIKEQSSLIAPGADEIWRAMDRLYCDFHSVRNDYTEALENLLAAWDKMLG